MNVLRVNRLAAALLLACLGAPSSLGAQQLFTVPLDSGTLVRLRLSGELVEGRLLQPLAPTSTDIRFCRYPGNPCFRDSEERVRTLPTTDIQGLDVQNGTRWQRGMLIGGAIGFVVGLVGSLFTNGLCDTGMRCFSDPAAVAMGGMVGGMGWGLLFGSTSIVWRPAP